MHKLCVFISYTLQGGEVDYELLVLLKSKLNVLDSLSTYIDLLDNNSEDHQAYVLAKLAKANFVLLIQSSQIKASVWVKKELDFAKEKNIPIIPVSLCDVKRILEITSKKELLNDELIQKLTH